MDRNSTSHSGSGDKDGPKHPRTLTEDAMLERVSHLKERLSGIASATPARSQSEIQLVKEELSIAESRLKVYQDLLDAGYG